MYIAPFEPKIVSCFSSEHLEAQCQLWQQKLTVSNEKSSDRIYDCRGNVKFPVLRKDNDKSTSYL